MRSIPAPIVRLAFAVHQLLHAARGRFFDRGLRGLRNPLRHLQKASPKVVISEFTA